MTENIGRGKSYPLGSTVCANGVNFSVFSKNAVAVHLLLFDTPEDGQPVSVIRLDPKRNKTYHYWHAFVPDLKPGQVYGYRVIGPHEPHKGLRFDPDKVLLDPYGKAVAVPKNYSRKDASLPGSNAPTAMKSVVADLSAYRWEGDSPLYTPFAKTVIYEMHVAGFTRNPNSGVAPEKRGTYAGIIEKIPYLQGLGITAVELLPVFQFDEQDAPLGLVNYWGYCPVSFFAPHVGYSSRRTPLGALDEFRDMVKAFHRAGIEVILDVVYNHTTEGNHEGPSLCFRGLENAAYYMLDHDRERYADFSGTGNTLNANQPIVRRLILDSLHYWVREMHVDGFRFDLASILSRDEAGRPMENPPILWDIESDPELAGIKLIAEAWDAAGLYQVGSFAGDSWKEWNGRFRDDVRRFLKGEENTTANMAARLVGSPDLYGHEEREPEQSINFVTCHDGFTLNDLVSYDSKHNEANGEGNRDGHNDNLSWNCGLEGPTDDPAIEALRKRQIKNFLAITLLSVGTPMLLMGDEVRRTQYGNNNAYCQDNETSWFDWSLVSQNAEIHGFLKRLISARLHQDQANLEEDVSLTQLIRESQIQYHGTVLNQPDWSSWSHSLAVSARSVKRGLLFHLLLNGYWEPITFEIPQRENGNRISWRRWLDTFLEPPDDIQTWTHSPVVRAKTYLVQPRSVVALVAAIDG
jgi:isoamylase